MRLHVIVLILSGFSGLSLFLFLPISPEVAFSRASDELNFYCTDAHLECERFVNGKLAKETPDKFIFEWNDASNVLEVVQVRVPKNRIGDLTFGVLGSDVTLGSYVVDQGGSPH